MSQHHANALGKLLKDKRLALGYSTYDLARAARVRDTTVQRIEQGRFSAPRPDKLARFAEALGLSLADVYAKAGYLVPTDLPSFKTYLEAKYPALPQRAVRALQRHFTTLAAEYGLATIDQPHPTTKEMSNDAHRRRAA